MEIMHHILNVFGYGDKIGSMKFFSNAGVLLAVEALTCFCDFCLIYQMVGEISVFWLVL